MKNPNTRRFDTMKPDSPDNVNAAIAKALVDDNFAADVEDKRILWTIDNDGVHAYFRTND